MNNILKRCFAALLVLCLILGSAWRGAPAAKAEEPIENADTSEEIKQPEDNSSQEATTDDELNALLEFYAFMQALPEKELNLILNAIKTALNTATLKRYAPEAVANADGFVMELWKETDHFNNANAKATAIKKAATTLIKTGEYPHDGNAKIMSITKAAGGKYNVTVKELDLTTLTVKKEDIPQAAVEQPTLHTLPAVNESTGMRDHGEDDTTDRGGMATCTERAICQICGAPYGKIDPNNHDWGEWKDVETLDGKTLQRRVCARNEAHTEERYVNAFIPSPVTAPVTQGQ